MPVRRSKRVYIPLLLITLFFTFYHIHSKILTIPSHTLYNLAQESPWIFRPLALDYFINPAGPLDPPTFYKGILEAPSPFTFHVPPLATYRGNNHVDNNTSLAPEADRTPALVAMHVFSTSTKESRLRRQLIRDHSPLLTIPKEYTHLVDFKFVLGFPDPDDRTKSQTVKEEAEIELERELYDDIIRLGGLLGGDNMNNGKSWEWVRYVGRQSRPAHWVFKCDDDTLPVLPNLLPILISLDPTQPTYIGSALGHWTGYHYYFEGMFYGFSWGVVNTLSAARVDPWVLQSTMDEDARMGELMFSLPTRPNCTKTIPRSKCSHETAPNNHQPKSKQWSTPPPSPDPRTGLRRLDLSRRVGNYGHWWIARAGDIVAWHALKSDEEYLTAYDEVKTYFDTHRGGYKWRPPPWFARYARPRSNTTS